MGKLKKDNADKAVRVEADGTIKLYGDTKPVENQQKSEIKELLKKAKKGDLAAQYRLSKYYFYGMCGLKKDSKKAVFWFEKYAERADSIKQWQIAVAYKSGKEIPQNYKKSVYWYTKAAEQGHVISQYDLGCFYYDGKIVAKDYEKAVYWFERAAEQESTNAMEKLAYCYKHGLGVEKSQTKADHYENLIFKITGKKPIPEQVKKPVTPTKELIGENRRTVYTLNPDIFLSELDKEKRLAESGDAEAQADLGFYYYHGFDDVKQDFEKAVFWLSKATAQGNEFAKFFLGCCYYESKGVGYNIENNYAVAAKIFSELAASGVSGAQHNLAVCYYYGHGVVQDYEAAKQLFHKAAAQGYEASIDALRHHYGIII